MLIECFAILNSYTIKPFSYITSHTSSLPPLLAIRDVGGDGAVLLILLCDAATQLRAGSVVGMVSMWTLLCMESGERLVGKLEVGTWENLGGSVTTMSG